MARFDGDTVAELMALWPSDAEFAREAGIAPKHAHAMKRRGSIPDEYRAGVVDAAVRRGIVGVTFERLTLMHAKRPVPASEGAAAR
jgi:hypothetical protein